MNKILIFVPMYNEADNVVLLYESIKKLQLPADILFLDDNSPDGTGLLIDGLEKKDSCVRTIHRPGKLGLGSAHIEGFKFARENNYEYLLTMDADFTHDPKHISEMLEKKSGADIVIGSRRAKGAVIANWGVIRKGLTNTSYFLIKYGLGLPYDCTTAFRLYDVSALKPDIYAQINSDGYSFFFESMYKFKKEKLKISEIPIVAPLRDKGASKISKGEIFRAVSKLVALFINRVFSSGREI